MLQLKMEDCCRLCGSEEGIKVNIFEPDSDNVRKIHKILPITLNEQDPLPKKMCHRCSYKVSEFFEFRSKCIMAQETFKKQIPWLRDKQKVTETDTTTLPMVFLPYDPINSISPNEKLVSGGQGFINENDTLVISDDSLQEESVQNTFEDCVPQNKIIMKIKKADFKRRPRPRSIWDSRKRRRKPQLECRITEVFTTTDVDQFYENENDVENDPLSLFPPQVETTSIEKQVKNEEKNDENIDLSMYFLVTRIPQEGAVYTCQKCARTFVSSQAATTHTYDCYGSKQSNSPKVVEEKEPLNRIVMYKCNECTQMFTRQSQLMAHKKQHLREESSSDDWDTNVRRRKRPRAKRKKRAARPLKNQNVFIEEDDDLQIIKHSLLSSESE